MVKNEFVPITLKILFILFMLLISYQLMLNKISLANIPVIIFFSKNHVDFTKHKMYSS